MTILFFTRLFYPHIGGVEKHIYEVGKRLIVQGHKVIIVTEIFDTNEKKIANFNLKGFEIHRIHVRKDDSGKKFLIWKWLWQNRKIIRSADIIHTHDVFFWYLPFRFIYPTKKVYITFHGYETVFPLQKKAIFIRKVSEILSTGNIIVGDYIKKWYGTKPDTVTYGGVDEVSTIKEKKLSKNNLNIVFIGRLEEDTGGLIYSEVLNILENNKVSFTFTALGDGSLRKTFARWGEVKGFVKDTTTYVEKADIVFASSYLSILQALVLKKVIVATYDNQLKKDYLTLAPFKKWITIEPDPVQLTHAIMRYLENPESFQSKISNGYEWAKKQTWEKVTNNYLNLWSINTK